MHLASLPLARNVPGLQPEQHESNYRLLKQLAEGLPDSPLESPVKRNNPFLDIEKVFLDLLKSLNAEETLTMASMFNDPSCSYGTDRAFLCIRDVVRTKRFLLAVDAAVKHLLKTHNQVNVLDAGCGPVAIQGLFAGLCSKKVKVTCLDLDQTSTKTAERVVKYLGLDEQISVLHADATTFKPKNQEEYNLIISETIFSAFLLEPVVGVLNNLKQFLAPGGIMIPHQMDLMFGCSPAEEMGAYTLVQYGNDTDYSRIDSFTTWEKILTWEPGQSLDRISFQRSVTNPSESSYLAYAGSEVHLFGSRKLSDYDSNVSRPILVKSSQQRLEIPARSTSNVVIDYPVCYSNEHPTGYLELVS